jgi:hypothetical protein
MSNELKACPFCGCDECYLSESDASIVCPNCGMRGPMDWRPFGDTAELIPAEMFNRRKPISLEALAVAVRGYMEQVETVYPPDIRHLEIMIRNFERMVNQ